MDTWRIDLNIGESGNKFPVCIVLRQLDMQTQLEIAPVRLSFCHNWAIRFAEFLAVGRAQSSTVFDAYNGAVWAIWQEKREAVRIYSAFDEMVLLPEADAQKLSHHILTSDCVKAGATWASPPDKPAGIRQKTDENLRSVFG